eukprot:1815809-Prymnesium_polylepis.1
MPNAQSSQSSLLSPLMPVVSLPSLQTSGDVPAVYLFGAAHPTFYTSRARTRCGCQEFVLPPLCETSSLSQTARIRVHLQ